MKKINTSNYLLYALLLSCFYSCSSPKIGFFNNSSPAYSLKEKTNPTKQKTIIERENNSNQSDKLLPSIGNQVLEEKAEIKEGTFKTKKNKGTGAKNISGPVTKLNKEEKKEIIKYIKEAASKKTNKDTNLSKGVLVILAILLPPLAVALVDGITGAFWLSIVLTLLFYLPGLLYALYRIFRTS